MGEPNYEMRTWLRIPIIIIIKFTVVICLTLLLAILLPGRDAGTSKNNSPANKYLKCPRKEKEYKIEYKSPEADIRESSWRHMCGRNAREMVKWECECGRDTLDKDRQRANMTEQIKIWDYTITEAISAWDCDWEFNYYSYKDSFRKDYLLDKQNI